jgi:AbrB family looped-hinge helix DNA binding protein
VKDISVIFGKKGRTTIPLPLRRKLGWQAGDTIRFRLEGDKVIISRDIPMKEPAAKPAAEPSAFSKVLAQLVLALLGGGRHG